MPSRNPKQRIGDILENIAAIESYVSGLNQDQLQRDRKTRDAVERCLQRISEAASKLGKLAEELQPSVPWHKLRGLGNVLRHEYDAVRTDLMWQNISKDLPPLKTACLSMQQKL